MPKLSVLMPIYNGVDNYPVKQMRDSIKSILALDIDLELIVVNDGSTDNTGNYLRHPMFNGITIIDNQYKIGQADSLNKALAIATGEYIWQWSVRGTALPDAVELVNVLNDNPDIGFVSGMMLSYGGKKEYTHRPPHIFNRQRYTERYLANFYMFRRIDNIAYTDYMQTVDGKHIGVADRDMLMQLLERGAVGVSLHDVLCVLYYNGGYHTMNEVTKHRDEIDTLFWKRWEHMR